MTVFQGTGLTGQWDNYFYLNMKGNLPGVQYVRGRGRLSASTTHLVVGHIANTEKLLSAVASGRCWILPASYLHECTKKRRLLREESYVFGSDEKPRNLFFDRRRRLERGPVFKGETVVVLLSDSHINEKVRNVMECGGAKILVRTVKHLLHSFDKEISYVVTDPSGYEEGNNFDVQEYWELLDKLQSSTDFLMPSYVINRLYSKTPEDKESFSIFRAEVKEFLVVQRSRWRLQHDYEHLRSPELLPKYSVAAWRRPSPTERPPIEVWKAMSPSFEEITSEEVVRTSSDKSIHSEVVETSSSSLSSMLEAKLVDGKAAVEKRQVKNLREAAARFSEAQRDSHKKIVARDDTNSHYQKKFDDMLLESIVTTVTKSQRMKNLATSFNVEFNPPDDNLTSLLSQNQPQQPPKEREQTSDPINRPKRPGGVEERKKINTVKRKWAPGTKTKAIGSDDENLLSIIYDYYDRNAKAPVEKHDGIYVKKSPDQEDLGLEIDGNASNVPVIDLISDDDDIQVTLLD